MQCLNCKKMIPEGYTICPWCGMDNTEATQTQKIYCEYCGTELQPGYVVCPKCATPVSGKSGLMHAGSLDETTPQNSMAGVSPQNSMAGVQPQGQPGAAPQPQMNGVQPQGQPGAAPQPQMNGVPPQGQMPGAMPPNQINAYLPPNFDNTGMRPVRNKAMNKRKVEIIVSFALFTFISLVILVLAFIIKSRASLLTLGYSMYDEDYIDYVDIAGLGYMAIIFGFFAVLISGAFWIDMFAIKSKHLSVVYVFAMISMYLDATFVVTCYSKVCFNYGLFTPEAFLENLLLFACFFLLLYLPFIIWGGISISKLKKSGALGL